jgi:ribonuclease HI
MIAFGRGFLAELSPRSSWLSHETSEMLPSDGVIFYTDGSLCEGRAGAGVFSDTLDIKESYALGSLATCSDYCRSTNMHNMTICICSDSKAALLDLSSYTISSKLLYQCWLLLQDLSNNNRLRLLWVPGHCDIKENEEADRLAKMGLNSHFCGQEPCVPLSASIVRDMNRKWVIYAHSKHWIAQLQTTKYFMSLPKKTAQNSGFSYHGALLP